MDGKQARRTGNSTPLGLLFDHGADAFAVGFQCMMCSKCLTLGTIPGWSFVYLACSIFYFATLEEYYKGGLYLFAGNSILDTSIGYYIMFIICGFMGNDIMLKEAIAKDALW